MCGEYNIIFVKDCTHFPGNEVTFHYGDIFNGGDGETDVVVELVYAVRRDVPDGDVNMEEFLPSIGTVEIPLEGFSILPNVSQSTQISCQPEFDNSERESI